VRALIKENKIAQMYSTIQTGAKDGMQTLDQCLKELVKKGMVDAAEARGYAENKVDFV
jgi:twitching motility protein PilT